MDPHHQIGWESHLPRTMLFVDKFLDIIKLGSTLVE